MDKKIKNEKQSTPLQEEKKKKLEEYTSETEEKKSLPGSAPTKKRQSKKELRAIETEEKKANLENLIDTLLTGLDKELTERGLTSTTPIQKMFLREGAIGCGLKYGFSLDKYPEVLLGCGVVMVGVDKYTEVQALKKKKEEKSKEDKQENPAK